MGREWGWTVGMRYVAVRGVGFTHVNVFRYRLGIAMNSAVVKVGLGRKCCGLGSAYHESPNRSTQRETGQRTLNARRFRVLQGQTCL